MGHLPVLPPPPPPPFLRLSLGKTARREALVVLGPQGQGPSSSAPGSMWHEVQLQYITSHN